MKKILVIGAFPPPTGGMETVMEQMFSIHIKGCQLIAMNVAKNKIIKSNILFNFINFVYRCLKLIFILVTKKPYLVHIHISTDRGFWQKAIYHKIAKLFRKKTVSHMHGAEFKEFYNKLNPKNRKRVKNVLNETDAIIVLSKSWKNYYSKITDNKKIFIIKNAVEEIDNAQYHRIYPKSQFIVLFLSRICQRKGAYDLIETIKKINKKNVKFVFVGPYENKEEFFKKVKELKIKDKCEFVGEILGKERFKYFASADLFVLPSYAEGLPVAILEAMSFGLPIISTTVGAIPEVVKKENGLLITPGNKDELYEALKKILSSNIDIDKISRNNKKLIQKEYALTKFQHNLEKVYYLT
jgi:glycosyltransferase involved in cell wall biosynthesis